MVTASQALRFFGYFQSQFFNARTNMDNGLVVKQNPLALQPCRLFVQCDWCHDGPQGNFAMINIQYNDNWATGVLACGSPGPATPGALTSLLLFL